MSSNVSKLLFLWIFSTALISCSSEKDTPTCQYESQPQTNLEHSPTPERLGLSFRQDKLVELMWTSTAQSECFLRKNGGVRVFKIISADNNTNSETSDTFVLLKPAPQASQQNWIESQGQISGILLGLTTFKFYSVPIERILSAEILLLANGRPWHLWHEYAHFLIGDLRVKSTNMSLRNPLQEEVRHAREDALAQTTTEAFEKKFTAFSNLQLDYMQKAFLDEILIEQTLQDLISQGFELLPVDDMDFKESQYVVERFLEKYNSYIQNQERILQNLQAKLSEEQQSLIQKHLERIQQQRASLLGGLAP